MNPLRTGLSASALLVSLSCTSATAAVASYTSRAAFESAVGTYSIETFNAVAEDASFQNATLDLGFFAFTGYGPEQQNLNLLDAGADAVPGWFIDGTTALQGITGFAETGFTIRFDTPLTAWGADFFSLQAPLGIVRTQVLVAGQSLTPPTEASSVLSFYGFSSDLPFDEIRFVGVAPGFVDGFMIDNLSYTTAVPEPASWILVLASLGALVTTGSRRSARRRAAAGRWARRPGSAVGGRRSADPQWRFDGRWLNSFAARPLSSSSSLGVTE